VTKIYCEAESCKYNRNGFCQKEYLRFIQCYAFEDSKENYKAPYLNGKTS